VEGLGWRWGGLGLVPCCWPGAAVVALETPEPPVGFEKCFNQDAGAVARCG